MTMALKFASTLQGYTEKRDGFPVSNPWKHARMMTDFVRQIYVQNDFIRIARAASPVGNPPRFRCEKNRVAIPKKTTAKPKYLPGVRATKPTIRSSVFSQ